MTIRRCTSGRLKQRGVRRRATAVLGSLIVLFNVLGAFFMPIAGAAASVDPSPWNIICTANGFTSVGGELPTPGSKGNAGGDHGALCTMCLPMSHAVLAPAPYDNGFALPISWLTATITLPTHDVKAIQLIAARFGRAPPAF